MIPYYIQPPPYVVIPPSPVLIVPGDGSPPQLQVRPPYLAYPWPVLVYPSWTLSRPPSLKRQFEMPLPPPKNLPPAFLPPALADALQKAVEAYQKAGEPSFDPPWKPKGQGGKGASASGTLNF